MIRIYVQFINVSAKTSKERWPVLLDPLIYIAKDICSGGDDHADKFIVNQIQEDIGSQLFDEIWTKEVKLKKPPENPRCRHAQMVHTKNFETVYFETARILH